MSRAAEIALMSPLATVTLAWSGRLMICGTTNAARMPRITTTTMISISVKPRCLFTDLPHQLIERQNWHQDGQHDDQHHRAHEDQHERLEQADQQGDLGGQVVFLVARGARQHL